MLAGCQSVVEFPDVPATAKQAVIESILTNKSEVQKTRVSFTVPLNDTLTDLPVDHALVFISSNTGDTVFYNYTTDGWYESKPFAAEAGKLYTLNVTIDTTLYKASDSLIRMNGIDALHARLMPGSGKDSVYYVYFNVGPVDKTVQKYYLLNVYKNDSLITRGRKLAYFTDKYLSSYADINVPDSYAEKDTVKLELLSLSKNVFLYYNSLFYNILREDISSIGYQTNPPCMFNKPALGYFQVSEKDEKTIVITRQ